MRKAHFWDCWIRIAASALLLSACAMSGVSPTGLTGAQITCPAGPRQSLDCRGVLQQYARDFKADLDAMSKVKVGFGITSTKLTEADALTSDLLQHYYQTCTLYNACIISPQEYAAKTEKLQEIQLHVRRALVSGPYGAQQNIQINPPFGTPFPPHPPGAFPPGGFPPGGYPQPQSPGLPPGGYPGSVPPVGMPQMAPPLPPGDPGLQQAGGGYPPGQPSPGQGTAFPAPVPPSGQGVTPGLSVTIQPEQGAHPADVILNILREGSKLFRGGTSALMSPATGVPMTATVPAVSPSTGAPEDLDTSLRGMLVSLKQEVVRQSPVRASARAVVGNFTEEGQPWSSPLGALLKDRVAALVETEGLFRPPTLTRGITVKQIAAVQNPNAPQSLSALYSTDLAIAGTYRPEAHVIHLRLIALDDRGSLLAQASKQISMQAVPNVVASKPINAGDASQLLDSLSQLGPKTQGDARVEITTNRPGAGASFRLGEEIKYFVTSTMGGYLYLFHMDADKNLLRLFPNQYQRDVRISARQTIEVPPSGAPFKFEASPPFGLETTFAIVTATPLDERDFQLIEGGFAKPKQEVAALVTRGISVKPASQLVWNYVTVLIRP